MKHIDNYKLFKESNSYKEISKNEFDRSTADWDDFDVNHEINFINDNWVPFTKHELNGIKKVMPDAKYNRIIDTDVEDARIWSLKYDTAIIKLKDEWYYVETYCVQPHYRHFKCDQFDSLIELIKNIAKGKFIKIPR